MSNFRLYLPIVARRFQAVVSVAIEPKVPEQMAEGTSPSGQRFSVCGCPNRQGRSLDLEAGFWQKQPTILKGNTDPFTSVLAVHLLPE